MFSHNYY